MRKVRKVPRIGMKALLSFPSVRLRGDSAGDTLKHQILLLKMAKDYLMVPCQYAEDRWGLCSTTTGSSKKVQDPRGLFTILTVDRSCGHSWRKDWACARRDCP
jgi:hypothetical protein